MQSYENAQKAVLEKFAAENQFEILDWEKRQKLSNEELNDYNKKYNDIKSLASKELLEAKKTISARQCG